MSAPIKDGGSAFPVMYCSEGMTLRDFFAGQALAGILASANFGNTKEWIGGKAYEAADSMLSARNQGDAK
jgi:hypothetical protein